jgi:transposase
MTTYIGIDWSSQKHDVCFVNAAGAAIARRVIAHTPAGFAEFEHQREQLGVEPAECVIGIETAHNLLLDYLWGHHYSQVYVIPPNQVNRESQAHWPSGARSDPSAAYLLAEMLRQERTRFPVWCPDSLLTRQMRSHVSLIMHLTRHITALSNRLWAVLCRYYPAAITVFSELTAQIELAFIGAYPTPQAATQLTWTEFQAFAAQHHYTQLRKLPAAFARLQQPQPVADADTVATFQPEAAQLAQLLLPLVQAKQAQLHELTRLFRQHPDAAIFDSLPGAGEFLAPGLLVKFGDDRNRFPEAASVQALAGTCPVTDSSGKRHVVRFRKACDHEFRTLAQQWAQATLTVSPWAQAYWQDMRPHCRSNSAAYRRLANRWLAIVWKLWQTHQPYDEDYHLQQRAAHSHPRATKS